MHHKSILIIAFAGLSMSACDKPNGERSEAPTYGQMLDAEQQREREEFIAESQMRLNELQREIDHLQAKIEHESQFVDAEKREDWREEVRERKQEREDVAEQLGRAQAATPEEWERMRGEVRTAIDKLEVAMRKFGAELQEGTGQQPARLCELEVEGAQMQVEREPDAVVILVTTTDQNRVGQLRSAGWEMAKDESYAPSAGTAGAGSADDNKPVKVRIDAQEVDQGVKLRLVPDEADELDRLYSQVSADATRVESAMCEGEPMPQGQQPGQPQPQPGQEPQGEQPGQPRQGEPGQEQEPGQEPQPPSSSGS